MTRKNSPTRLHLDTYASTLLAYAADRTDRPRSPLGIWLQQMGGLDCPCYWARKPRSIQYHPIDDPEIRDAREVTHVVRNQRQIMYQRCRCNEQVHVRCGFPSVEKTGSQLSKFASDLIGDSQDSHVVQEIEERLHPSRRCCRAPCPRKQLTNRDR